MQEKGIHICLITSGRVFEVSYGGEEKFTISLAKWLIGQNIEVTLLGSTFAGIRSEYLNATSKVFNRDDSSSVTNLKKTLYPPYAIYSLSRIFIALLWIARIIYLHKKHPFAIIHAQDTGYAGLASIIAGKIIRIPVVISSHGIRHKSLESIIGGLFRKFILRFEYGIDSFNVKYSDKVIAVSPVIKKYYENISKREIDFIPIPIDVRKFAFSLSQRSILRKELEIKDTEIILSYIGRLSPEKNVDGLLRAFMNCCETEKSIRLVIVGAGILENELKLNTAAAKYTNRVQFCGVRSDVHDVLSATDIVVLPSFQEGMSTILLEAMACSRAIICSNLDANRALLTDEDCVFVDPSNPSELELAIKDLGRDLNRRMKLGSNAYKKVQQYDEEKVFSKILNFYKCIQIQDH